MSTTSRLLTRTFLVGVLIVSTTYGASALTVQRTNKLIDGVFVPVLVVRNGGETFFHQIGEDGLTRAILFDADRALAWAQQKYGAALIYASNDGSGGGDPLGGSSSDGGGDDGGDDDENGTF